MTAAHPGDLIGLFSQRFAAGDIEGLMALYESGAVFPTHHGEARGPEEIRRVLQGYISSGAKIVFDRQVAFEAGDIAMIQNGWTLTTTGGEEVTGISVEVARRQDDGSWKYVFDSPDGAALLKT
jgi:ketosteroid isomerase-like protein